MIMERKPLVVVPGLVRRDAIAYLQEHVDVRQWTEKTKMPREVLKEWLRRSRTRFHIDCYGQSSHY